MLAVLVARAVLTVRPGPLVGVAGVIDVLHVVVVRRVG
jgi:hypothetical protein